ncbi:signal transduction histidine kinase [Crossiella equi]|uniref:Signal transduction histidine kinase n=1 Tax=Crossiella equi TaxID=130796 RepID=A0ABS5A4Y9_9PSEU|nr:ATP-binding protein [Crossiella equi]MBP2471653.1 signal transduction histidine kinase [Crossiella equi]
MLTFRWLTLCWLAALALVGGQVTRPWHGGALLCLTLLWTAWLTLAAPRRTLPLLVADLVLAVVLTVGGGWLSPEQQLLTTHPSFAGAYPFAAVAEWGIAHGAWGGALAGGVLALAVPFALLANAVEWDRVLYLQGLHLIGTAGGYVLVGAVVGAAMARLAAVHRYAGQVTERAARLAERQWLVARIHDDVLQRLGVLRRQARDLAEAELVPGREVLVLAEALGRQEEALRGLDQLSGTDADTASVSLRAALDDMATGQAGVPVRLVASGPLPVPAAVAREVAAAVGELLANVAKHAEATQVWITALEEAGGVSVSVRDNGVGFAPERALTRVDALGLRVSVQARLARLGGTTRLTSRPGEGTEVELWLPNPPEEPS